MADTIAEGMTTADVGRFPELTEDDLHSIEVCRRVLRARSGRLSPLAQLRFLVESRLIVGASAEGLAEASRSYPCRVKAKLWAPADLRVREAQRVLIAFLFLRTTDFESCSPIGRHPGRRNHSPSGISSAGGANGAAPRQPRRHGGELGCRCCGCPIGSAVRSGCCTISREE